MAMNTEPFRSARNYSYGKRSRGKFRIPNAITSDCDDLDTPRAPSNNYYVVCSSPVYLW